MMSIQSKRKTKWEKYLRRERERARASRKQNNEEKDGLFHNTFSSHSTSSWHETTNHLFSLPPWLRIREKVGLIWFNNNIVAVLKIALPRLYSSRCFHFWPTFGPRVAAASSCHTLPSSASPGLIFLAVLLSLSFPLNVLCASPLRISYVSMAMKRSIFVHIFRSASCESDTVSRRI